MVRNVANLVPSYETARKRWSGVAVALEYSVKVLGISHIIVLAHSKCGGISALMKDDGGDTGDFIGAWIERRSRVREQVNREHSGKDFDERQVACEKASLLFSLKNLETYPWIRERMEAKKLSLHGWYFMIDTGDVLEADVEGGAFNPLK